MFIKLLYKIIPIVYFCRQAKTFGFDAYNFGLVILINNPTDALIAHELVHSRQFIRTAGFHSLLYYFSKSYRYHAEIEAYKVSYSIDRNISIVDSLMHKYDFNKTRLEILKDLNIIGMPVIEAASKEVLKGQ